MPMQQEPVEEYPLFIEEVRHPEIIDFNERIVAPYPYGILTLVDPEISFLQGVFYRFKSGKHIERYARSPRVRSFGIDIPEIVFEDDSLVSAMHTFYDLIKDTKDCICFWQLMMILPWYEIPLIKLGPMDEPIKVVHTWGNETVYKKDNVVRLF
jgi:hypothetical protein